MVIDLSGKHQVRLVVVVVVVGVTTKGINSYSITIAGIIVPGCFYIIIINPLRMRRRGNYSSHSVSVCYHSSSSIVDLYCPTSIASESALYLQGF